jgi:septal ring factor EnvC (AmiA/AmiB activator)
MAFDIFGGNKKKEVERKITTFSEQLTRAFGQIKDDISTVSSKIDANQKDMEKLQQWIDYLHRYNQQLSASHARIAQKHDKIAENHQKLHSSHNELHSSHTKTAKLAENLENRHQELSNAILAGKDELMGELHSRLKVHKENSEKEMAKLKVWVDYLSTHVNAHKRKEDDLRQDIAKMQEEWLKSYSQLRELVNALKTENTELKTNINSIQKEMKTSKEDVENAKNLAKSHILEAKSEIFRQLEALKPAPQPKVTEPQPIIQQVSVPAIQAMTASSFQKHIISRVMPNRRGYVLKFILDLIAGNSYSTKEIEEIVVNEKQLCGRTSFYAYLKELKLKGRINYAEIDERQILVSTDTQQRLQ